ncbi:hypothetical protein VTL71DRAFT_3038 [Oculimacula yallundae]|uniref:Uncharacterized protein n=1 Tax=Oculimacula yallundae TaxID=86028 RepID=A0ABR4C612_9HELO
MNLIPSYKARIGADPKPVKNFGGANGFSRNAAKSGVKTASPYAVHNAAVLNTPPTTSKSPLDARAPDSWFFSAESQAVANVRPAIIPHKLTSGTTRSRSATSFEETMATWEKWRDMDFALSSWAADEGAIVATVDILRSFGPQSVDKWLWICPPCSYQDQEKSNIVTRPVAMIVGVPCT